MEGLTANRVVPTIGPGQVFGGGLRPTQDSVGMFEFLRGDEIRRQGLHGGVVERASRCIEENDEHQQTQVDVIRHDEDRANQDRQRAARRS